jgi:hypothetical protein
VAKDPTKAGAPTNITTDHQALVDMMHQVQAWCERHHYLPMDAVYALRYTEAVLERTSQGILAAHLQHLEDQQETLTHHLQAIMDMLEASKE